MTQATGARVSRAGELLLVRLLAAGGRGGPGPKRVRDELAGLGADVGTEDKWAALVADLRGAGRLADGRGLKLTDAGRARGLAVLGLTSLPAGATWPRLRDQHLIGLAAGDADADLRSKGKLAAHAISRKFGLRVPERASLNTVVAALVCKEMGFPALSDLKALQGAVLGRVLKAGEPLPPADAVEQFVRAAFGLRRGQVGELRQALIREWVGGADDSAAKATPGAGRPTTPASTGVDGRSPDLATFAAAAQLAAAASVTGRFGDNKVFIAHAWRQYQAAAGDGAGATDLPAFKARLVEANRAGLLTLSRADLVAAMDAADVRQSETTHLSATFHFILVPPRKG